MLRAPATVTFNNDASSMKTTDVADMLSQSLGLPSLSDADTVHARIGSLNAPRASVLFVADGHDMDKNSMWQYCRLRKTCICIQVEVGRC